jgi:hypothetical protein
MIYVQVRRMKTILEVAMYRVQVKAAERGVKLVYVVMKVGSDLTVRTVCIQVTKVGSVLIEMGVRTVCVQVMKVGFVRMRGVVQMSMKRHRHSLLEVDHNHHP